MSKDLEFVRALSILMHCMYSLNTEKFKKILLSLHIFPSYSGFFVLLSWKKWIRKVTGTRNSSSMQAFLYAFSALCNREKKGGAESLEGLLGKSQPPWEKGCIVTRLIQAPTCCGTLRGLIQQIALKYPINSTTKAEGVIDHKRS